MNDADIDALLALADRSLADAKRLLDVAVVARRVGFTDRTVRNWIASGKVQAVRSPTGRYRITVSELARLLHA